MHVSNFVTKKLNAFVTMTTQNIQSKLINKHVALMNDTMTTYLIECCAFVWVPFSLTPLIDVMAKVKSIT